MYNRNMSKVKKAKAKKETSILNRRVSFDYFLGEEIIAGIALTGPEVRAARDRLVQLKGSFVTIRNGEVWLNNASFSLAHNEKGVGNAKTVDTSARKLLLNRKQIEKLQAELKMEKAKRKKAEMETSFLKKLDEIERRRG